MARVVLCFNLTTLIFAQNQSPDTPVEDVKEAEDFSLDTEASGTTPTLGGNTAINEEEEIVDVTTNNALQPQNPTEVAPANIASPANAAAAASSSSQNKLQQTSPALSTPEPGPVTEAQETKVRQLPPNETNDFGPSVPKVTPASDFGGVPLVPGTLRSVAKDEAPESYTVEPGDTLYDICDQMLDEANYWPKLWALNPFIKNPHFIYPGMKLAFYPGDEDNPPYLQVITEDDVVPIDKAALVESELVKEDISKLLVDQEAPRESPVIGPADISSEFQAPFEFWGSNYNPSSIELTLPAFIYKEEKTPLAVVTGGETGKFLSTTRENIVVEADSPLTVGTTYSILRRTGDLRANLSNDYVGVRYEFIAHINITKALKDDYFGAKVTTDHLGVKPGDIVVEYISTRRKVPIDATLSAKEGGGNEVVAFGSPSMKLGGESSFVIFSNREGSSLQEGDTVKVYHQLNRLFTEYLKIDLPEQLSSIGVVYILASTDAASIGYVVDAKHEIVLGDTAGETPKM